MANWNQRMLSMAHLAATWSKDPSRQIGAVIFNPWTNAVLAQGYNGLARGADDSLLLTCDRPTRLLHTCHAETNAIYNAARHGIAVSGMSIASTLYPCAPCALAIIQSGIMSVITYEPYWLADRYAADFAVTRGLFAAQRAMTVTYLTPQEPC